MTPALLLNGGKMSGGCAAAHFPPHHHTAVRVIPNGVRNLNTMIMLWLRVFVIGNAVKNLYRPIRTLKSLIML